MGNQKDFHFKGLVFNNKNEHEIISSIDYLFYSFYNDDIYLFSVYGENLEELFYNGAKKLIEGICSGIKIVEIEAGSFKKNFPNIVDLLRSENDFRLDCAKFGKRQRDLFKSFNKKAEIIFKND